MDTYCSGEGPPCRSFEEYRNAIANFNVEAPPGFFLVSPQTIKDGQQGTFGVLITGGIPVSYSWSFTSPSGAGNNPNVTFSASSSAVTNTNGHWFAKPNVACPTQADIPAYYDATYTIKATVMFSTGVVINKTTTLTVNSFWSPAGFVNPNQAIIAGIPAMASDGPNGTGTWRVVGKGTLVRVVPTQATINVIPTSQFYNKTVQHEQVHVNQFVAGPGHLFGDLWNADTFYNQIVNVTGTSESDLITKLGAQLTTFLNAQGAIYQQRRNQAEIEAHNISDPIAPQYVYQNCGQYGN